MSAATHSTQYDKPVTPDSLQAIPTGSNAQHIARRFARLKSVVVTAADATAQLFDILEAKGEIVQVRAVIHGAMPASGESMTFDVLKNGVSVLSSVITHNSSVSTLDKAIVGTLDATKVRVEAGDKITWTRDYTAGGGPTPMTDTVLYVEIEYDD